MLVWCKASASVNRILAMDSIRILKVQERCLNFSLYSHIIDSQMDMITGLSLSVCVFGSLKGMPPPAPSPRVSGAAAAVNWRVTSWSDLTGECCSVRADERLDGLIKGSRRSDVSHVSVDNHQSGHRHKHADLISAIVSCIQQAI